MSLKQTETLVGRTVEYDGAPCDVKGIVLLRGPGKGALVEGYLFRSERDGLRYVVERSTFEAGSTPIGLVQRPATEELDPRVSDR